jgi:hypothetical protein
LASLNEYVSWNKKIKSHRSLLRNNWLYLLRLYRLKVSKGSRLSSAAADYNISRNAEIANCWGSERRLMSQTCWRLHPNILLRGPKKLRLLLDPGGGGGVDVSEIKSGSCGFSIISLSRPRKILE